MIPVTGTPLVDKTRVAKTITKVHKDDSKIIIDIESSALDVPYGDYFVTKEMWVVYGSESDPSYPLIHMKQFYQVKFNKSTWFKG